MEENCSVEHLADEDDYKSQSLLSHQRKVENITHKKNFVQLGET